jgi:ferredoxin
MADQSKRLETNIDGEFFVDSTCVGCEVCVIDAPKFFKMTDPTFHLTTIEEGSVITITDEESKLLFGKAYVYYQPTSDIETNELRDTMLICPSDSIGENKTNAK